MEAGTPLLMNHRKLGNVDYKDLRAVSCPLVAP